MLDIYLLIGIGFSLGMLLTLIDDSNSMNLDKVHIFVVILCAVFWLPVALFLAYVLNRETRVKLRNKADES